MSAADLRRARINSYVNNYQRVRDVAELLVDFEDAHASAPDLLKQRDELAEALRDLIADVETRGSADDFEAPLDAARAALAKVKP